MSSPSVSDSGSKHSLLSPKSGGGLGKWSATRPFSLSLSLSPPPPPPPALLDTGQRWLAD